MENSVINSRRLSTVPEKLHSLEIHKAENYFQEIPLQNFVAAANVLKTYKFSSENDKGEAINKLLELTAGREIIFSVSSEASQVIAELFPWADKAAVERFRDSFRNCLWLVVSHPFACRVLKQVISSESSIKAAGERVSVKEKVEVSIKPTASEDSLEAAGSFLLEVAEHILVDLDNLVWNPYASSVIRRVLELLSADALQARLLVEFAERLATWLWLADLVYNSMTSQLVEAVLLAVRQVDSRGADTLVTSLLEHCFLLREAELQSDCVSPELSAMPAPGCPLAVFRSAPASRLLAVAINSASVDVRASVYGSCFSKWMSELSSVQSAGRCLQLLIDNWEDKEEFAAVYQGVTNHMVGFLAHNPGVLVSLARACLRLDAMQNWFILHLMVAVKCDYPVYRQVHLVTQVLQLAPLIEQTKEQFSVQPLGVDLLEALLRFSHPNKVVASLLAIPEAHLRQLLSRQEAPALVDAFMTSPHINTAAVDKFFSNISESCVSLACCKQGSHTLATLWRWATATQRTSVVSALASRDNLLNKCGQQLANTFGVALYTYCPDEWRSLYSTKDAVSSNS